MSSLPKTAQFTWLQLGAGGVEQLATELRDMAKKGVISQVEINGDEELCSAVILVLILEKVLGSSHFLFSIVLFFGLPFDTLSPLVLQPFLSMGRTVYGRITLFVPLTIKVTWKTKEKKL